MNADATQCVYGPVPSRRLGRSLGIDLVPFKTCSYDCIYCQLGRTTNKTTQLKEYVPVDGVLDELASKLPLGPTPDFIGLAGSGEPTLHARIGDLIAGIKNMTNVPVAVLTNGSMLWMPEVRKGIQDADLVLPSLDAGNEQIFERVNRSHQDISFNRMTEGLIAFAEEFRRPIWLEVFVLAGVNDRPADIGEVAAIVKRINPARVQLNTVSRPPAEDSALAVPRATLEQLCGLFPGFTEVISEDRQVDSCHADDNRNASNDILALLSRRPCTVEGISAGLGLSPNQVIKHLDLMCRGRTVRFERREDVVFCEEVRTP